jgi:hypothetical protein
VNGYSVRTESLYIKGGLQQIGNVPAPAVAQRCDLVDVDTQFCHLHAKLAVKTSPVDNLSRPLNQSWVTISVRLRFIRKVPLTLSP